MTTPDLMSADEARSLLAAMTPGTLEVAEIRDGRLIDAAAQELAVVIHDDARAHQKPDGTWHSVIVCRGMDGPTRDANAAAFAAVKRALATVAAHTPQPVPALGVAAIDARAAALSIARLREALPTLAKHDELVEVESADLRVVIAHITALRTQHAAEVAAAVARERETCARLCEDRAAHLDAGQGEEEPDDANDEEMEGYGRFLEALHLAEAIRGRALAAPAPTTGGV